MPAEAGREPPVLLGQAAAGILPLTPRGAELGKCTKPSQSKFTCMNLLYLTPP